jgi:hypothetical protein
MQSKLIFSKKARTPKKNRHRAVLTTPQKIKGLKNCGVMALG